MRITQYKIFLYAIPYSPPLNMRGKKYKIRRGLIIGLANRDGVWAYGEYAPFPPHTEKTLLSFVDGMEILLREQIVDIPLEINSVEDLAETLRAMPDDTFLRFALESALWQLKSREENRDPRLFLADKFLKGFSLNALITELNSHGNQPDAKQLSSAASVYKIKVGQGDMDEEIRHVQKLCHTLPVHKKLRLDANRNWSFEQAEYFLSHMNPDKIEYIEEPLKFQQSLEKLYLYTGIPYAYDETLHNRDFKIPRKRVGLAALIIKPALVGNMARIKKLARAGVEARKKIVFTSAFESGLGLSAIACMASAWGSPATAMGLGTFAFFSQDTLQPPFSAQNMVWQWQETLWAGQQLNSAVMVRIK